MVRVFKVFVPTSILALIVSEIVIIFSCFLIASYVMVDVDPEVFLLYDGGLARLSIVVGSVMLGLYFQDMYNEFRVRSRLQLVQQLCLVVGIVFLFQALLTYLNPAIDDAPVADDRRLRPGPGLHPVVADTLFECGFSRVGSSSASCFSGRTGSPAISSPR